MPQPKVKVAAVQAAPVFLDLEASLQKALTLIEKAAAEGGRAGGLPRGVSARLASLGRRGPAGRGRGLPPAAAGAVGGRARPGDRATWRGRPGRRRAPGHGGQRARGQRRHRLNTILYLGADGRLLGRHPKLVPTHAERLVEPHGDWMLDGYSVIVDPAGTVLAGPLVREEGILYATLDLDAARARRRLFDPVGHYNRPDVFRLVVDDRPKPHLVSLSRAGHSGSS